MEWNCGGKNERPLDSLYLQPLLQLPRALRSHWESGEDEGVYMHAYVHTCVLEESVWI